MPEERQRTRASSDLRRELLDGDVEVIVTDILSANGVIHVIDAVLLPPAGE